jgi:hypothetical protein
MVKDLDYIDYIENEKCWKLCIFNLAIFALECRKSKFIAKLHTLTVVNNLRYK